MKAPQKISLAMRPTPLTRMITESSVTGVELWVKRDDLTGSVLTGNKVRKLEYLLADAQREHADVVVTCGGEQSNHCRATAIAARQLGMDSVLFLRTEDPQRPPATTGNLLLDRVVGADVRFISRADYRRRTEIMSAAAVELRVAGARPYLIPEGGSNALGSLGYYDCVGEIAEQLDRDPLTIVFAAGSGGTGAGLFAGVHDRGLPWRVVAINVCDDRAYFVAAIGAIVEGMKADYDLSFKFGREMLEIVDGYVGRGYAKSRPEELASIVALGRSEGLVLDPVYTGKAWHGLRSELARDPRSLGERIVFLHSGGVFGLLAQGVADDLLT